MSRNEKDEHWKATTSTDGRGYGSIISLPFGGGDDSRRYTNKIDDTLKDANSPRNSNDIDEEQPPPSSQEQQQQQQHENSRMEHLGQHRQYARDMILGVNDGIISTFLLVAGVSGSGLTTTDIFLTAVAGALAGAVSMSAGEFIATKSQNEVLQGEIGLERVHIRDNHDDELKELTSSQNPLLDIIGVPPEATELRQRLIEHYSNDKSALLRLMIAVEFGVVEEEERSPLTAAIFSGLLFFVGSLPSVIPFAFSTAFSPEQGLFVAAMCTSVALLVVGGIKTWATRGNCCTAAIENLSVAGFGGLVAYFVGQVVEKIVHRVG
jgi:vacuolar iron transporter family protein